MAAAVAGGMSASGCTCHTSGDIRSVLATNGPPCSTSIEGRSGNTLSEPKQRCFGLLHPDSSMTCSRRTPGRPVPHLQITACVFGAGQPVGHPAAHCSGRSHSVLSLQQQYQARMWATNSAVNVWQSTYSSRGTGNLPDRDFAPTRQRLRNHSQDAVAREVVWRCILRQLLRAQSVPLAFEAVETQSCNVCPADQLGQHDL